ncbi:hypothetical protein JW906_05940 [bacterium]|nr:hypothetical protein [bacterium]
MGISHQNSSGSERHPFIKNSPKIVPLAGRMLGVLLPNAVPVYGVLRLGWDSTELVLLFILEGVIILFTDVVRVVAGRCRGDARSVLFFEGIFILFFGLFAVLVFGPYASLEDAVSDGFRRIGALIIVRIGRPLMLIAFFRLVRLVQDLFASGFPGGRSGRPLALQGGAWMLLLFFAVMTAPFIAKAGPNPKGGLFVLVLLKALGECFAAWADTLPPDQKGRKAI